MQNCREDSKLPIADNYLRFSPNKTERALYPFWEAGRNREFPTSTGEVLRILSPGTRNTGKGPDYRNCFFQKKHRKRVLMGDVEIHLRASDWTTHQHHKDPNYGKVLLHVFLILDTDLNKLNFHNLFHIPLPNFQLEREPLPDKPSAGCNGNGNFHTEGNRAKLAEIGFQKLKRKGEGMLRACPDRQTCLLSAILRVHGQPLNSEIFFNTGLATMEKLLKARNVLTPEDIFIVLAGTGRLLHTLMEKSSFFLASRELLSHYLFRWEDLKAKYKFTELSYSPWELHGIRPGNHPFFRLLQFAFFLKTNDLGRLTNVLKHDVAESNVITSCFSINHEGLSSFPAPLRQKVLSLAYSRTMLELILTDAIIPWFIATQPHPPELITLMNKRSARSQVPRNRKTRFFTQHLPQQFKGFTIAEIQGLIGLHDEFCIFRDISCAGCLFHPEKRDQKREGLPK